MAEDIMTQLDQAVALCLVEPSSFSALTMVREARKIAYLTKRGSDGPLAEEAEGFHSDCLMLHGSLLTLESDPEIIKRNMIARVISGIFPLLNTIEEYTSIEDGTPWDMLLNGMGILSEMAQATQYLEATRLSAIAHTERELVRVEERLVYLAMSSGGDLDGKVLEVHTFLDRVRELSVPPREKPLITFLLWSFISVLSYRRLKDLI